MESKKALVVIDLQNDITKHYKDIIANVNTAIDWAKAEGMQVVYIKHHNKIPFIRAFIAGTKGAELVPEMKIISDNIFVKEKGNALTSKDFAAFVKDKDIKEFYKYQLEQMNNETDIYSNIGLLEVLEEKCFNEYKKQLLNKYKSNFLLIQKKIDFLLQSLIDKMSTIPYTVRCICKIIYLLISKKFPLLPKYIRNSFVGKFIFEKSIFPVLSLENKNIMENKILSNSTKNCLYEIINFLGNANKCMLYNCNNDTERTIFNYYLIEIVPILNKFYDKLIDVKLPKY